MTEGADQLCSKCHAHISAAADAKSCPACGGELVVWPGKDSAPQAQVDHRGIVLPSRHAVGGVITPR